MALLWWEGFDQYASAQDFIANTAPRWTVVSSGVTMATGRDGTGRALSMPSSAGERLAQSPNISYTGETVIIGLAVHVSAVTEAREFYRLYSAAGAHFGSLWFAIDGSIYLQRVTGSATLVTSPPGSLSANAWAHVQLKLIFTADAQGAHLRVGNLPAGSAVGINLGATIFGRVAPYRSNTHGHVPAWDDLWVADTSGNMNNDWLGDAYITYHPPGIDDVAEWMPSAGGQMHPMVSEGGAIGDGNATYIETQTEYSRALFRLANQVPPSNIVAVAVNLAARKTESGSRAIRTMAGHGAVTARGPIEPLSDQYRQHLGLFERNPATDVPWNRAEVNAMRFGGEAQEVT